MKLLIKNANGKLIFFTEIGVENHGNNNVDAVKSEKELK